MMKEIWVIEYDISKMMNLDNIKKIDSKLPSNVDIFIYGAYHEQQIVTGMLFINALLNKNICKYGLSTTFLSIIPLKESFFEGKKLNDEEIKLVNNKDFYKIIKNLYNEEVNIKYINFDELIENS